MIYANAFNDMLSLSQATISKKLSMNETDFEILRLSYRKMYCIGIAYF